MGLRNRYLLLTDMGFVWIAYFFTLLLAEPIKNVLPLMLNGFPGILATAFLFAAVLKLTRNYAIYWFFAGTKDYAKLCICAAAASVLSIAVNVLAGFFPPKIAVYSAVILSILIIFSRMAVRAFKKLHTSPKSIGKAQRLLIVGAGASAAIVVKDIETNNNLNYEVVGFIDDDKAKQNAVINGIRVLGSRERIVEVCKQRGVDEILIAMSSATSQARKEIIEICNETGCQTKIVPSIDQVIDQSEMFRKARKVNIEDLLVRDPVKLDNAEIAEYIENRVVLVTGGGGSIGSELCRQIMKFNPKKLIIVDIYENNAYDLQMELNRKYPNNKPEVLIASVREQKRMEQIFRIYHPYIVFHAAAHKHVPLMETSPCEAVKNNIFGTYNIAKCADKYGTKRFVMISTDKAVNPTNVMGATKRMCEMIVQCMSQTSKTEFVAVRFGNVLGSNGSVIPLFEKQIAQGGPVTVTHRDITRFFMTIPEAAQLVLQAGGFAKGGEIFVLDMGDPVKIYDLAKNMIRLSGYTPGVDIAIEITGLRPGEKLYEELLMNEENMKKTAHEKIFIGNPLDVNPDQLASNLAMLHEAVENRDEDGIKDVIAAVVPTYSRPAKNAAVKKPAPAVKKTSDKTAITEVSFAPLPTH